MLELNEFQTPLDDKFFDGMPQEVRDQFWDAMNNIELVGWLVKKDRPRAKDLPRDDKGRIIVDIVHPHILEDMDYFRPTAITFQKTGKYTTLRPNANPNSEYGRWFREELRRCWEGYVRESDGEWITGYMYFFLNYCPIILTKIKGKGRTGDRVSDFPDIWEGIYLRFHYMEQARNGGKYSPVGGHHCAELATRGAGKSYSLASILTHDFLIGVNKASSSNITDVVTAYQKEYLTKDGVLTKFLKMADFLAETTQFPRKRLKNSTQELLWQMGYRDVDLGIDKGTKNTVIGVSSKDDSSKLRGKRASHILIEEFGTFRNLIDLYNNLIPSVQEGDVSFGQIYCLGTAGDDESDFAGAQELMYSPEGYNMYALPNVYDRQGHGRKSFVYFFPAYLNRKGCMNEDGVSDVTKSLRELLMNRYVVKYNSQDPNTIVRTIAERPITPSEAIIKAGQNMFPVTDLTERLGQIDANPAEYDTVYVGDLVINNDGNVEWKPNSKKSIHYFPTKDNKVEGAIEIFQMPEKNSKGDVIAGRYIGGIDPYDDDQANTMSLGSIFILDLWSDTIAAEYTGRPKTAADFYEICRRMCLFYNAKVNYENNKKGLFGHFSMMNSLWLLTDNLEFLKDKQMIRYGYGNTAKGTVATKPINDYARTLLRQWLMQPVMIQQGEQEVSLPNLYRIRNRALLQELIGYNSEGNFDRVSSMGMLMLLREDIMITMHGDKPQVEEYDADYLGNDPFFKQIEEKPIDAGWQKYFNDY